MIANKCLATLFGFSVDEEPSRRLREKVAGRKEDDGEDKLDPCWDQPRPVVSIMDAATKGSSSQDRPEVVTAVVETSDYTTIHWMSKLDDVRRAGHVSDATTKAEEEPSSKVLWQGIGSSLDDGSHDDEAAADGNTDTSAPSVC